MNGRVVRRKMHVIGFEMVTWPFQVGQVPPGGLVTGNSCFTRCSCRYSGRACSAIRWRRSWPCRGTVSLTASCRGSRRLCRKKFSDFRELKLKAFSGNFQFISIFPLKVCWNSGIFVAVQSACGCGWSEQPQDPHGSVGGGPRKRRPCSGLAAQVVVPGAVRISDSGWTVRRVCGLLLGSGTRRGCRPPAARDPPPRSLVSHSFPPSKMIHSFFLCGSFHFVSLEFVCRFSRRPKCLQLQKWMPATWPWWWPQTACAVCHPTPKSYSTMPARRCRSSGRWSSTWTPPSWKEWSEACAANQRHPVAPTNFHQYFHLLFYSKSLILQHTQNAHWPFLFVTFQVNFVVI